MKSNEIQGGEEEEKEGTHTLIHTYTQTINNKDNRKKKNNLNIISKLNHNLQFFLSLSLFSAIKKGKS